MLWPYVATVLLGAEVQVAPHLKTRLLEPSFLKLEEHGAGAPWSLADGSIWQHTRLWLHPDVPNVFGFAFSEASVTSRHVSVEWSLNFTHSDFLLPDSFVATWLVPAATMDMAVSAQAALFKNTQRKRADAFPLWKADTSLAKFSGLAVIAHRSAETPQVGVKVVNFAEASASLETLNAAFSAKENALSFNPAKTPILHLALLHAEEDASKRRLQVWARPAGEGFEGTWTPLLKEEKTMPLSNPWRLGFSSYSGTSDGKVACGVQVTAFHVHSFELAAGAASKEYLGNLQGRVSEEKIQEALKGIGKDLNAEYIKHAEVMAGTREQLQRLEKQVAQMMAKVDGFNHSAPGGEHHDVGALLHVLKQTKDQIQTDTTKVAQEFNKKASEAANKKTSKDDSFEAVVTKLDSTVEKHGGGSSMSSFLFLAIAMGACASVYKKMRTYEKRHHL
jgi:hypothetical protein